MMKLQRVPGLLTLALLALAAFLPRQASAALLAYNSSVTGTSRGDGPFTVGELIQVQATDQIVTALGVQDAASTGGVTATNGFANSGDIQVGIWNATGTTLLASASVNTADPLGTGNYRYHTLTTPITLTAGTQYLVGALVGAGNEWFIDNGTGTAPYSADTGFTLVASNYHSGSTLAAPTSPGTPGTVGRWGAANALTTPAPEPASVGLLASVGCAGLLRRRRSIKL